MTIISNRKDYDSLDLGYYLDNENVADCKFREIIKGFEVFALNKNADQFMIFNNSGKDFYIIETSFEEVKEFLNMFY